MKTFNRAKPLASRLVRETVWIFLFLGILSVLGVIPARQGCHGDERAAKGEQLSMDHIIPPAVMPELNNAIANLKVDANADEHGEE